MSDTTKNPEYDEAYEKHLEQMAEEYQMMQENESYGYHLAIESTLHHYMN